MQPARDLPQVWRKEACRVGGQSQNKIKRRAIETSSISELEYSLQVAYERLKDNRLCIMFIQVGVL